MLLVPMGHDPDPSKALSIYILCCVGVLFLSFFHFFWLFWACSAAPVMASGAAVLERLAPVVRGAGRKASTSSFGVLSESLSKPDPHV